jgi:TPR repeat protein
MTLRRLAAALLLLPGLAAGAAAPDPVADDTAAKALRQRAEKGDGDAALRLGNLLARDRIPAARYGRAIDWYRKGCSLGDLSACHNAGISYQHGRNGVQRNDNEAAHYYLQAADGAFINSIVNLVGLYAEEKISGLDHRDGLKWQYIAERAAVQCPDTPLCKSVLEDRRGHRAKLESRLSADDRREARRLAGEWRPAKAK